MDFIGPPTKEDVIKDLENTIVDLVDKLVDANIEYHQLIGTTTQNTEQSS